ncbi:uncharacterized protein LOC106437686 isoform X1 [Brassica napus]|uniref:uncharacterized protein LOC106437686 isoform X1 n=1 Tax=Brassica napus TaxID=3708 RepID=UPI00207893D0|nr:uncharacterized protein LOC106437686 isoform X1 [Brassica napus]XP_048634581.1 uncharacterized protein LOC106437686 isoform X1 [Brassica napus]
MANYNGYVNLLASQGSIDLGSSQPFPIPGQSNDEPGVKERRKWTTKEDVILIGAWLNTSKDPIVSNEQKAGAFWRRIVEYYNASPLLVGTIPRELGQCKQRWARINDVVGSPGTLNDINVLDRSPVFDDIYEGRAPRVTYMVNGHQYDLAYYLTDGIYPKWSTFIQSITLPQGPKAELFAKVQEATRKDVERAFGVLQARFAIVKNPALSLDKGKIGNIMRACIILHNMIVENERGGYTLYDTSEFEEGESSRSSHVEHINNMPTHFGNMLGLRNHVRDRRTHQALKNDLIENIWNKFGDNEDV